MAQIAVLVDTFILCKYSGQYQPGNDSEVYRCSEGIALMSQVRRVKSGKTAQLDELARECGHLYSQIVVFLWGTVRHKGIWLKPKHLMPLMPAFRRSLPPPNPGENAKKRAIKRPNHLTEGVGTFVSNTSARL